MTVKKSEKRSVRCSEEFITGKTACRKRSYRMVVTHGNVTAVHSRLLKSSWLFLLIVVVGFVGDQASADGTGQAHRLIGTWTAIEEFSIEITSGKLDAKAGKGTRGGKVTFEFQRGGIGTITSSSGSTPFLWELKKHTELRIATVHDSLECIILFTDKDRAIMFAREGEAASVISLRRQSSGT